jgi:hypothetical protein
MAASEAPIASDQEALAKEAAKQQQQGMFQEEGWWVVGVQCLF